MWLYVYEVVLHCPDLFDIFYSSMVINELLTGASLLTTLRLTTANYIDLPRVTSNDWSIRESYFELANWRRGQSDPTRCQQSISLIFHSSLTAFSMRLHEFLSIVEDKYKLIFLLIGKLFMGTLNVHGVIQISIYIVIFFICNSVQYKKRHKKWRRMWCNFRISLLHNSWFSHLLRLVKYIRGQSDFRPS